MADPANECFALRREDGSLTGEIKPRALVHRDGDLHGASHVFLARLRGGRAELLLQKRSAQKDSFPGLYDISAAGHLDPGEDFAAAARRELAEELGVTGEEPEFLFAQRNEYHGAFHGKPFHDNEIAWVYLLVLDRPEEAFTPEACEVESGALVFRAGDPARHAGKRPALLPARGGVLPSAAVSGTKVRHSG